MEKIFQIVFYVPADSLEQVKSAMFLAGAGQLGDYQECCWQIEGQGQFRPIAGANPHIGDIGNLEQLQEFKVEMLCVESAINAAVAALKSEHPYEEVAYFVLESRY